MAELPLIGRDEGLIRGVVYPREAMYYEKLSNGYVRCLLCYHRCKISEGESSFCKTRVNNNGILHTVAFSNPCAVHAVPIEKEPMYHFLPGTMTLSIAVAGCNFRCNFCQNWLITQFSPAESMNYFRPPASILDLATMNSCPTINYTFSEPTVFYEYMLEIAKLAKPAGIKNICHANGFLNEEPLRHLCKFLDAICIDLKGFEENFYQNVCGASLEPVLRNLKIIKEEGVHLEIVNLIIPEVNDDLANIEKMCEWIIENLGPDIPLHFLGFRPRFKFKNMKPAPIELLGKAHEIAKTTGLYYSFISDILSNSAKSTYCPRCKNILIGRENYSVDKNNILNGKCRFCNIEITGRWMKQ